MLDEETVRYIWHNHKNLSNKVSHLDLYTSFLKTHGYLLEIDDKKLNWFKKRRKRKVARIYHLVQKIQTKQRSEIAQLVIDRYGTEFHIFKCSKCFSPLRTPKAKICIQCGHKQNIQ